MKSIMICILTVTLFASCQVKKNQVALIQDCPDEKIINKMPRIIDNDNPEPSNIYFIYKGERRELTEFDLKWVEENCDVKESEVH